MLLPVLVDKWFSKPMSVSEWFIPVNIICVLSFVLYVILIVIVIHALKKVEKHTLQFQKTKEFTCAFHNAMGPT